MLILGYDALKCLKQCYYVIFEPALFPYTILSSRLAQAIKWFNTYMPSVYPVGYRQTVQTQIRLHRTLRLIRLGTLILQKVL